eukprot:GGOE01008121.1.p1 GENE.GGOE01008121.1~~GGOE01008121.1.p1  ORF type:complete len:665 (-),score=190.78 GGOE01008121.1:284-2278(-)
MDLQSIFEKFCAFGTGKEGVTEMDSFKFSKLCRETKLFDKNFGPNDTDVVFASAKVVGERKINFAIFKDVALPLIAAKKGCTVKEVVAKLKETGGPLCTGTKAEAVKWHDDKSTFTGVSGWKVLQQVIAESRDEQSCSPKERKAEKPKKKKLKKKKKHSDTLPRTQTESGSSAEEEDDDDDESSEAPPSPQSGQEGAAEGDDGTPVTPSPSSSTPAPGPANKLGIAGGGTTVQVKMRTVQQVALAAMEQAKKGIFPTPLVPSIPVHVKVDSPASANGKVGNGGGGATVQGNAPRQSPPKAGLETWAPAAPSPLPLQSSVPSAPSSASQSPTNHTPGTPLTTMAVPVIKSKDSQGALGPVSAKTAGPLQLNLAKVEAVRPRPTLLITPRSAVPLSAHVPAPPMAPKAGRFQTSKFKEAYDAAEAPSSTPELLDVLQALLTQYAALRNIETERAALFFEDLKSSAVKELHSEVQLAAARLWTSPRTLDKKELCFILNELLREDHGPLMPLVAIIARAINLLLVGLDRMGMTPASNVVFRGGGLPDEHRPFFSSGRKYRVPMFTATSVDRDLCQRIFCRRAEMHHKQPPVLWVIALDERDGCKHVNYIHTTECKEEQEYLFTPYSVFSVQSAQWKEAPQWKDPHIIYLRAAVDNRLEPEDLPLSPWA